MCRQTELERLRRVVPDADHPHHEACNRGCAVVARSWWMADRILRPDAGRPAFERTELRCEALVVEQPASARVIIRGGPVAVVIFDPMLAEQRRIETGCITVSGRHAQIIFLQNSAQIRNGRLGAEGRLMFDQTIKNASALFDVADRKAKGTRRIAMRNILDARLIRAQGAIRFCALSTTSGET
jgi:hypothetical protein